MPRAAEPGPQLELDGQRVPVQLRRHRRARRYILRVREDGAVHVTLPPFGSRREALAFVQEQQQWVSTQRAAASARREAGRWTHGTSFLFRGRTVRLDMEEDLFGVRLRFGDQVVDMPAPAPDLKEAVTRHLRRVAETEIPARARELAAAQGLAPARVTVRAQRTLWGSCSGGGTLSFNWRLILAPPWVRDYVILHELAHLREMSHSRRFWSLVRDVCPRYRRAEHWLRTEGERLR